MMVEKTRSSLILLFVFVFAFTLPAASQKPANGSYVYDVAFAEWNGQSNGATVRVTIQGDSIFVYHNGGNLSGKSGELINSGIILWHKSKQWIIAYSQEDKNAAEVGGCSGGPSVIDFKKKTF